MLIVLLDCSRSMREPFAGEAAPDAAIRVVTAAEKIDVARQALREILVSAPSQEMVIVLGFAGEVVELARGHSIDGAELEARIEAAALGEGADLLAALAAAASALRSDPTHRSGRVILISDGLLDGCPAEVFDSAIDELADLLTPVEVELIDLSQRGLEIARRIARHGYLTVVTSGSDLEWSMPPVPMSQPAPAPRVGGALGLRGWLGQPHSIERGRSRPRRGKDSRLELARQVEDVAITVAHAPSVARGRWHSMDVFVHLVSLEDEVSRIVRAERGPSAARASRGARLREGTVVRIEPHIDGAELDIEALELRWLEDLQRAAFRFRPSAVATELRGSVDLYVKHVLLCSVPVTAMVLDDPQDAAPASIAMGRLMETVFVSYATEDRPIVEWVTRPYRELGITVLMDKDFLHVGATTSRELRTHIERADVFQLYWSTRSSRKPWVEREWRHALTLTGPAGRKGSRFIRPLVWERRPPAWPPELAALQFGRLDATWFAAGGARQT